MDLLTFGLAFAAYTLLGGEFALRAWGRRLRALTAVLAVVLTGHVALVWGHRFGGSLEVALGKGIAGFVIFHAAFAAIVAAAFAREPWSTRLLYAAFPVASLGAIGAAFKYEVVEGLRIPLLVVCAGTLAVAAAGRKKRATAAGEA